MSAIRGASITLLAFVAFFLSTSLDRIQHVWAYVGSIALAFALHYVTAWLTMRQLQRRREGDRPKP